MEKTDNNTGAHPSELVRTPENPLDYSWLTVDQAVAFCAERGLSRTPKTLQKWAERSYNKPDADIVVRRADTMWGYRWKIEQASLSRKVAEELSLADVSAPVRTSANTPATPNDLPINKIQVNRSEPVRTGAETFTQPIINSNQENSDEPGSHLSEHVRTGAHDIRPTENSAKVLSEVRERLRDKDAEIAFLRDQLGKAQAEVERRATSTDEALKTIDRVVRSFEMQAEANKALALSGAVATEPVAEKTGPIRFTTASADEAPQDIATAPDETPSYQQHQGGVSRV